MSTTVELKRKNIDLPVETLRKLSVLAVAQGKSLKSYIESILISKADSISVEIKENPSPSGDKWFLDEGNLSSVQRGLSEMQTGEGKVFTIDEIKNIFGG